MKKQVVFASLHLPKTSFPLRPNNERFRQQDVIDRITTLAYRKHNNASSVSSFHLLDGPPFANGQLHIGHFLNKVLKDMFNRYQATFCHKRLSYTPGWDCHGLPIELLVKRSSSSSLTEIREKSRKVAENAMANQAKDFQGWGVLADWNTKYTTMSKEFEAKELRLFADLLGKGFISRRLKPVYWSPKSQTALAEAELEYKDNHESSSVFVKFKLLRAGEEEDLPTFIVAWTTTPWSLTGNMALALNKDAEYAQVEHKGQMLIVAKERVSALREQLQDDDDALVIRPPSLFAKDLMQWRCESPHTKRSVPIITSEHVTLDSGTGVVHIAPLHGLEDFDCFTTSFPDHVFTESELTIDRRGRFKPEVFPDQPEAMTVGNFRICEQLERDALLVGPVKPVRHRYPMDWRTKTPIMIMATNQFFLRLHPERAQAVCEKEIATFVPESGKSRLIKTIGSRKEWCLSRQRVWGLPIPYYQHKTEANLIYITKDLVERFAARCEKAAGGSDFWFEDRAEDDALLLPPSELKRQCWQRGRDTLDVWFDSGSVWYSSSADAGNVVADLVVEGSDQHRGWFQSSVLLKSSFTMDDASSNTTTTTPFKAIVTHGFVLDEHRQKMSKSLGNVITPQDAIKRFNGNVDVLRLWVAGADISNDVLLSQESLDRAADKMKKIRHLWRFFLSLGKRTESAPNELDALDKAMLHLLRETRLEYCAHMNAFQARLACNVVMDFLHSESLKAYVETRKDVLYCGKLSDVRRQAALAVFEQILLQTVDMLSPVCVFTVDEVKQDEAFPSSSSGGGGGEEYNYPDEYRAFERLLHLRTEVNQLKLDEAVRNKSRLIVTVTDEEGLEQLQCFTNADEGASSLQWSNAAEMLQVLSVTVQIGTRFSLVVEQEAERGVAKCARCRKMHESVSRKQQQDGEGANLCQRCTESEASSGK